MADKILQIIYYIVYAAGLFFIGNGIFRNRLKEKAKYAAVAGVYLLIMIPAVLFLDHNAFIILALNLCIHLILFQGTVVSRILHFISVYLLLNLAESIIFGVGAVFLNSSFKRAEMNAILSGTFSIFFAVMIMSSILYFIYRKRIQNFILYFRALNRFQYLVIIMIVWSGILLLGIHTAMPTILFMGMALIGIVLLVFSTYGRNYYLKQNNEKEEIIRVQQMYFQNVYDNNREMHKFRHDISSQLRFLGLLLADGKTEDALEHLQTIGTHFEELTLDQYHTGNELLDVILNQKIQEAQRKGIHIEFEGKLDKPDFMDTYDLCTLFSNTLDNSIEACESIQDREAIITGSILTHRNTVLFRFANPATAEMYEAIRHGRTTKPDPENHGLGMENIQTVVHKYGGETDYSFKDGTLIIEMYFEI